MYSTYTVWYFNYSFTLGQCYDAQNNDDGNSAELAEHEHILQAGGDLHASAVDPSEEGDAESRNQLQGDLGDGALREQGLQQVVGHRQGHYGICCGTKPKGYL